MHELKELVHATLALTVYLFAMLMWVIAICACVALVLSLPIFVVAAVYKIGCLILHVAFSWDVPIIVGIGIVVIFGLAGLDQMWE